jgi:hypothetical protein
MMDAMETPVERLKALGKMARGEYDHINANLLIGLCPSCVKARREREAATS